MAGNSHQQAENSKALDAQDISILLWQFDDPFTSLHALLVPDLYTASLTYEKVDHRLNKNVIEWGTKEMKAQVVWGYIEPINLVLVDIIAYSKNSDLRYHRQSLPQIQIQSPKRRSVPVAIPSSSMRQLSEQLSEYIRHIALSKFIDYGGIAYSGNTYGFSEDMLKIVIVFYGARKAAGYEVRILYSIHSLLLTLVSAKVCVKLSRSMLWRQCWRGV